MLERMEEQHLVWDKVIRSGTVAAVRIAEEDQTGIFPCLKIPGAPNQLFDSGHLFFVNLFFTNSCQRVKPRGNQG